MRKSYLDTISSECKNDTEHMGRYLKEARLIRNHTVEHVCSACRMGRNTLIKAEKGDVSIDLGVYLSLLTFYGFSPLLADMCAPHKDLFAPISNEQRSQARRSRPQNVVDNDF